MKRLTKKQKETATLIKLQRERSEYFKSGYSAACSDIKRILDKELLFRENVSWKDVFSFLTTPTIAYLNKKLDLSIKFDRAISKEESKITGKPIPPPMRMLNENGKERRMAVER